jgi:cupin 2 domain-containing protein
VDARLQSGRLEDPERHTPAEGERVVPLLDLPGVVIEQILSGLLPKTLSFEQDHDEWVLVLDGQARLRVDERDVELGAGEWLLLPSGCRHSVVATRPGTSWLAVHVHGPPRP